MRLLLPSIVLMSLTAVSQARPLDVNPTGVSGHHIGETVSDFLAIEAKARRDLDTCRQNPAQSYCDRLLAALERRQRAEISTSDTLDFTFDQGKLVKLATLVDGMAGALVVDLTKTLGPCTSEMDIQKRDDSGAKWTDNVSVWEAPDAYVLLVEDNNPTLSARHPVIVVESPAEHTRSSSDLPRGGRVKKGLQKALWKIDPVVMELNF